MSWIDFVKPEHATGPVAKIYTTIQKTRGKVARILQIQSLLPDALEAHLDLYMSVVFERSTALSRRDCELIATVVSKANGCRYCVQHHGDAYNRLAGEPLNLENFTVESLLENIENPSQTALLNYAVKLTDAPNSIEQSAIERLDFHGFDDRDILHLNLIVSYFNFVNRIALGLGVETDPEEIRGYDID
jgi:uncharacterized peroxidase-related enzyme